MRNYRTVTCIVFLTLFNLTFATKTNELSKRNPKLIVSIVVEGLRADYLTRFKDRFSENGLKRLIDSSYYCKNARVNYIKPSSAPSHASIFTGAVPSIHGIVGNTWLNESHEMYTYCVSDPEVRYVGIKENRAGVSPKNLKANTIGDQLKISTNFKSKVVSISVSDRAAILSGGRGADVAYFFDTQSAKWVSSDYYIDELPRWIKKVNDSISSIKSFEWETLYPSKSYTLSTFDDVEWESELSKNKNSPTFPKEYQNLSRWIRTSPVGMESTFSLAQKLITHQSLGLDEYSDLLNISLNAIDYIGHSYGPNSVEIEDSILRLDQLISSFIGFLNHFIKKEDYLLVLTSAHGMLEAPEYLMKKKLYSGTLKTKKLLTDVDFELKAKFGDFNWIDNVDNPYVYLNHTSMQEAGITRNEIVEDLKSILENVDGIYKVVDLTNIEGENLPKNIERILKNSIYPSTNGSADLIVVLSPNWMDSSWSTKGSNHVSFFNYDTQIPVLFYGCGIKPTLDFSITNITDIAPTLCQLLGIAVPNAASGELIIGLLNSKSH